MFDFEKILQWVCLVTQFSFVGLRVCIDILGNSISKALLKAGKEFVVVCSNQGKSQ